MKYLNILDTNILVSFLLNNNVDGTINQLIKNIYTKNIIPIYSEEIYEEYKEVLNRIKFNFESHKIGQMLNIIKDYGIKIKANPSNEKMIDSKDQIFYDVLMSKRDDNAYLVTGNLKHFPLREYIVNAKEMLNIILKRYT